MTETPHVTERWVYQGKRLSRDNKLYSSWAPESDPLTEEGWWYAKLPGTAIGGIYEVRVDRTDGKQTVRGDAVYTGEIIDGMRTELVVLDSQARSRKAIKDGEKRLGRSDELDYALRRLREIAENTKTYDGMVALRQYVGSEIEKAWRQGAKR